MPAIEAEDAVEDRACAVGRVTPGGAWIGFERGDDAYLLLVGSGDRLQRTPARRGELLALALAYFGEALDAPPPENEATQQDLAELVAWLLETEPDTATRARLREALDAIDDGLAADVLVSRLRATLSGRETAEQVDPIDLLVRRAEEITAGG